MRERRSYQLGTSNIIVGVLVLVVGLMLLFWLARSLFTILAFVAPLLLVATLVINYRIVVNYGKWLWNLFQKNFINGLLATLMTVIGFPVVCFVLFGKALLQRKVEKLTQSYQSDREGQFVQYEEVSEEIELLELPQESKQIITEDTDYEELFD